MHDERQGFMLGTAAYLSPFALGASCSLSESSCSSVACFRLLFRASALRMFASTLWCSAGSILFTSSKLSTQQGKKQKQNTQLEPRASWQSPDDIYKNVVPLPKFSDEFSEDVLQLCSEVPSHIIPNVSNAFHLNKNNKIFNKIK